MQSAWGLDPWVVKIPWRREWQPIPAFLPGKFQTEELGRATVQGVEESDTTEHACIPLHHVAMEVNSVFPGAGARNPSVAHLVHLATVTDARLCTCELGWFQAWTSGAALRMPRQRLPSCWAVWWRCQPLEQQWHFLPLLGGASLRPVLIQRMPEMRELSGKSSGAPITCIRSQLSLALFPDSSTKSVYSVTETETFGFAGQIS